MGVNDASRIILDDFRVTLQIVVSLSDDSRGVIYNCKMFIVQSTRHNVLNLFCGWLNFSALG